MSTPMNEIDGPCAVCVILDGDSSAKPVRWCNACKKWRCERCRNDIMRLSQAVVRDRMASLKQLVRRG